MRKMPRRVAEPVIAGYAAKRTAVRQAQQKTSTCAVLDAFENPQK